MTGWSYLYLLTVLSASGGNGGLIEMSTGPYSDDGICCSWPMSTDSCVSQYCTLLPMYFVMRTGSIDVIV